jgi:hypothetical protein
MPFFGGTRRVAFESIWDDTEVVPPGFTLGAGPISNF